MNEQRQGKKNNCDEASMYDNHAIGVYKQPKYSTLGGHIPIECSTLVDNFLNANKENRLAAVVTGFRKWEFGLIVQAEFTGRMKKRNIATTRHWELKKKNEKYRGHEN